VTRSSSGIGPGIAIDVAARGVSVVVAYSASSGSVAEVIKEAELASGTAIALQAD
jgi:3-oxoacyl-[acyl-carrier protein] reductase